MKLQLIDKKGIKLMELNPKNKYFLVLSRSNAGILPQVKFEKSFIKKFMASKYVFVVDDINNITIEEKKEFLKTLLNEK